MRTSVITALASLSSLALTACTGTPDDSPLDRASLDSIRSVSLASAEDGQVEVRFLTVGDGGAADSWSFVLETTTSDAHHTLLINQAPVIRRTARDDQDGAATGIELWNDGRWIAVAEGDPNWPLAMLFLEKALAQLRSTDPDAFVRAGLDSPAYDGAAARDTLARLFGVEPPAQVPYGSCSNQDEKDCEGFWDETWCCLVEAACDEAACMDMCNYWSSWNPLRYVCQADCDVIYTVDYVMCIPEGILN